ncbi:MAG: hypothetical protein K6C32_02545 [Bacilli bacterium]|nr:hypothetical protein [Bacilli bacterium]
MLLYLLVIFISTAIIAVVNILTNPMNEPWYYYLLMTLAMVAAAFVVDAIVAIIGRRLPKKWMDPNKKIFTASKKEMKFYEKIKVQKWKDKVPELGGFTDFHKNKLVDPWNNAYVSRYLLEACYGVVIHLFSPFFSFLILLADYKIYSGWSWTWLTIGLPVAIINAILIVLPTFILKYNIPKLKMLYEINRKNEERKAKQQAEENK